MVVTLTAARSLTSHPHTQLALVRLQHSFVADHVVRVSPLSASPHRPTDCPPVRQGADGEGAPARAAQRDLLDIRGCRGQQRGAPERRRLRGIRVAAAHGAEHAPRPAAQACEALCARPSQAGSWAGCASRHEGRGLLVGGHPSDSTRTRRVSCRYYERAPCSAIFPVSNLDL